MELKDELKPQEEEGSVILKLEQYPPVKAYYQVADNMRPLDEGEFCFQCTCGRVNVIQSPIQGPVVIELALAEDVRISFICEECHNTFSLFVRGRRGTDVAGR